MVKYDLIWNITRICPWSCQICCVDAVNNSRLSPDQLLKIRQTENQELSFEDKLRILENLEGTDFKLDFSGGDPLICTENIHLIKRATEKYSKQRLSVSTTAAGLKSLKPGELAELVSEIDFTYDSATETNMRPRGFNAQNLEMASLFKIPSLTLTASLPLSRRNNNPQNLTRVYMNLHYRGIENLHLLRYFPVGRAFRNLREMLTREEYIASIRTLLKLEAMYHIPRIRLQCALSAISYAGASKACDFFKSSFGITSKGLLLTSAWAIQKEGQPLDESFVLGSLVENRFEDLLNSEKGQVYKQRLDHNPDHCKVFAFIYSQKSDPVDRLFDKTDPLVIRQD